MSIRVVIADDQELVRTGFRVILDSEPDIEVVGPRVGPIQRGSKHGRSNASVDTSLQVAYFTSALINQLVHEDANGHP